MRTLYVAVSKDMQSWGADVGLGKHLYKVGVAEELEPAQALAGMAGFSDWKVLLAVATDHDEATLLERLALKEKLVDPNYYPKLKGTAGVVKVSLTGVENSMLVAFALDDREPPKNFKVKPADIATFLVRNLIK